MINLKRCRGAYFFLVFAIKQVCPSVLDGAYFNVLVDGVGIRDVGAEGEYLHGRVTHGEVGGLHTATHSDKLHLRAEQRLPHFTRLQHQ